MLEACLPQSEFLYIRVLRARVFVTLPCRFCHTFFPGRFYEAGVEPQHLLVVSVLQKMLSWSTGSASKIEKSEEAGGFGRRPQAGEEDQSSHVFPVLDKRSQFER
ncbi:hypothetical protein MRX96_015638 [Rhipicephalus microplus]